MELYRDEVSDEEGAMQPVIPVTYMNSAANLKAFCGAARRHRLHLVERRAGAALGLRAWAARALLPRRAPGPQHGAQDGHPGGARSSSGTSDSTSAASRTTSRWSDAKVILWKGWCSTHQRFTPEQIAEARAAYPGVRVVVHPECRHEVVEAADLDGSTEYIVKVIEESPAGTIWAVGTEVNLVKRLAREHPDKTIFCLDPVVCPCSTMYRIHPAYLAWVLESWSRAASSTR